VRLLLVSIEQRKRPQDWCLSGNTVRAGGALPACGADRYLWYQATGLSSGPMFSPGHVVRAKGAEKQ